MLSIAGTSHHGSLPGYPDGLTTCSAGHGLIAFFALGIGGASLRIHMSGACLHRMHAQDYAAARMPFTWGEEGTVHR